MLLVAGMAEPGDAELTPAACVSGQGEGGWPGARRAQPAVRSWYESPCSERHQVRTGGGHAAVGADAGPHGASAAKEAGTRPGAAGGTRECRVASRQGILRCPRRPSNGRASTVATVRQGLSPVALQLLMMRFPGRGALPIRPVPSRSPAQAGASLDGMRTSAENPKE